MAQLFMRMLDRVLRKRYAVIGGTVALFIAALAAMQFVQQQFFPSSDRPELLVDLTLPQGSSLNATRKTVDALDVAWFRTQPADAMDTAHAQTAEGVDNVGGLSPASA